MKLETNSKILLDITKSKSKLYEFGIEEQHHLPLADNPEKLLIFTIGILGELAALESRPLDIRDGYKAELKEQLVLVGQYFDALSTSKLVPEFDTYLKLLGATAYYLADMPGSSLVLARQLPSQPTVLTRSYLEGFLVWLLKSELDKTWYYGAEGHLNDELFPLFNTYKAFWQQIESAENVHEKVNFFRSAAYQSGDDRELLLADSISSLIRRKIHNSSILCLPRYTGLDAGVWQSASRGPGFIKEFWPAQRLLGEKGVLKGLSAVVQMPTSAGKTKSAELIIRSSFLSKRAKLAVVIAPFKALCREISRSFEKAFENDSITVNELRDITNIDESETSFLKFILGDNYANKKEHTVLVSTPEKLVYLLRHEPLLSSQIGLLIFDEGHQFDSEKRGVTYELLIASLKNSIQLDAQSVLISAVMANAETIGDWLNGERGVSIQGSKLLPSIKSVAFFSWLTEMGQLSYLNQDNDQDSGLYVPRIVQQINLGKRTRETKDRLFPDKEKPQTISAYLGLKLSHQGPVALFCGDKRSVTSISKMLIEYYERGLKLPQPRESADGVELDKIAFLAELHFGKEHIHPKAIKMGLLPHSSNIPNGIRISVEWAMENNKGNFVVCTSTLAQGVNLPIKYLIISSTLQGGKKISTRDFQNLIGRAGRSGYHTEGSIIFSNPKLYDEKFTRAGRYRWLEALQLLDFDNAEDCNSSLKKLIEPFHYEKAKDHLLAFISDPAGHRAAWIEWAERSETDIDELLEEMDTKQQTIEALESYFLSILKDSPTTLTEDKIVTLATETLAFHLATETEKSTLIQIFSALSSRLFNIEPYKYSYYGKTLLGLDQLSHIDSWIDNSLFELELAETPDDLLDVYWTVITSLTNKKIIHNIQPSQLVIDLAKLWMKGESYYKLLEHAKKQNGYCQAKSVPLTITLDHIMDLTASLSFEGMLIVGALADILEGRDLAENCANLARALQNRMKMGLSSELEMLIYNHGYMDREICKILSSRLNASIKPMPILDIELFKAHADLISETVAVFPSVFSKIKPSH